MALKRAINVATAGYRNWADKPHNAKWARRLDGTPIANDLVVCIANEFQNLVATSASRIASLADENAELRAKVEFLQTTSNYNREQAEAAERQLAEFKQEAAEVVGPFGDAADNLYGTERDGSNIWEHSAAMCIEFGHLRSAKSFLSRLRASISKGVLHGS